MRLTCVRCHRAAPQSVDAGLLWVAEQIPGLVVAADVTPALRLGYWPSFNVPYFPEVYNASGYPDFVARVGRGGEHFTKASCRPVVAL